MFLPWTSIPPRHSIHRVQDFLHEYTDSSFLHRAAVLTLVSNVEVNHDNPFEQYAAKATDTVGNFITSGSAGYKSLFSSRMSAATAMFKDHADSYAKHRTNHGFEMTGSETLRAGR
jgi:hypothetical protein